MRLSRLIFLVLASTAFAGGLRAQVVLANLTNFSGGEQVIDFNAMGSFQPILGFYASQGVTFSAGLDSSTNGGDTMLFPGNGGGVIATNNFMAPPLPTTWTITFAAPEGRAGFLVEMNTGDSLQLTTSLGGSTHGSVTYNSAGITPVFFGVQDTGTFDTLTFTVNGTGSTFFAMDDFRYEAIPEPPVFWLLGAGLPFVALAYRRRRAG